MPGVVHDNPFSAALKKKTAPSKSLSFTHRENHFYSLKKKNAKMSKLVEIIAILTKLPKIAKMVRLFPQFPEIVARRRGWGVLGF